MHLYRKLVSKNVGNGNENDLEAEIDQLLKQLQLVNSQMQAWVSSGGSEIFSHTLTRHQEILHDLNQVQFIKIIKFLYTSITPIILKFGFRYIRWTLYIIE